PEGRQDEVRDALLRPDRDDRLALRVEVDVPAPLVPVAYRAAQARYPLRHRVAVRVAALDGLDQLGHDVRRRRAVRGPHAEVDDVLAPAARGHLELGRDGKDVGRKARQARELGFGRGHAAVPSSVSARNRPSDVEVVASRGFGEAASDNAYLAII